MKDLVIMKDQQAVTTSLQIAEGFGKPHNDTLKAIRSLQEDMGIFSQMFFEVNLPDSYGRDRTGYYMNRDGFTLLAMGFTGKKALDFKLKYIEAFNEMENHIKQQVYLPQDPMQALELFFEAQKETKGEVKEVKQRVLNLEENQKLDAGEYSYVNRRVRQRVTEVARGYGRLTSKQRGEFFRDMSNGINQIAGVQTRTQLKQKDFKMVCDYINDWEPSTATKTIVRQMDLELDGD